MALVEGRALTSSDPCVSIVHGLLRHRKGDENDPFPKKAIESLVRKLKEKRDELDSLIQAVTSSGEIPSKCVTIPRTLDGRLQVATRKGFPHVVYARIWRWPDVHKNEMKHVRFCQFAFDLKRDGICINPYHYERIVPTGIDLAGLSIQQLAGAEGYGMMDDSFSPYQRRSSAGDILSTGADSNDVQDSYSDPYTPQQPDSRLAMTSHGHVQLVKQHSHPESTAAMSGWVNQVNQCSPTTSWVEPTEMPSLVRQSPIKLEPVVGHSSNFGDVPVTHDTFHSQPPTVYVPQAAPVAPESVAYLAGRVAGTVAGTDFWRNVVSSSDSAVTSPLSARPLPDIWCSITYFELDDRVGEIFKVPLTCPVVTVDGYTNPSSPDRFCLGKLTNVQRTETTEKARLHIGKGVQLVLEGEGDVWVKCLSDHSIFVQSYYLDRESGRQPGDAVHKIYPAAFIKVFDLNQCYTQMRQWAAVSQPTNSNLPFAASVAAGGPGTMGIGADDLRSLCVLRLSFVKGWGPDYPRPTIKDTPCWIEIQLHRPLQLLDEVLQMLASKESTSNAQFGLL